MLIHPDLLPDVLAFVLSGLVATILAWRRTWNRARAAEQARVKATQALAACQRDRRTLDETLRARSSALKRQYRQTDLLHRSERFLAARLAEHVEAAAITLKRESRAFAAEDNPYGTRYDGERCQPARLKARLDELEISETVVLHPFAPAPGATGHPVAEIAPERLDLDPAGVSRMNADLDTFLLLAAIPAGLSGWAAIGAWWLRERSKTVRGIKNLRRTNDRLQKSVVFTLDKWRDQVERSQLFLAIEQEYADRLARQAGVSASSVKTTVRAHVEQAWREGGPLRTDPVAADHHRHAIAAIEEVERFVETGEGTIAEFEVVHETRRAA